MMKRSEALPAQILLRIQDLRPEESEELAALRNSALWSPNGLTKLVQRWFGALGPFISAELAAGQTPVDDILHVSFQPPPDGNADLAEKAFEEGMHLAQLGQVSRALVKFEKAVSFWPFDPVIQCAVGQAYLETGDFAEAESALIACLRLDPLNSDALTLLGNVYLHARRLPLAESLYRRSIEITPTVCAMTNLGAALAKMNRLREACEVFQAAIVLDPAYQQARLGLDLAEELLLRHKNRT